MVLDNPNVKPINWAIIWGVGADYQSIRNLATWRVQTHHLVPTQTVYIPTSDCLGFKSSIHHNLHQTPQENQL